VLFSLLQVGTLSHMPPEMLRFGRMSPAADSYAFGIMLLTLYTGQEAFRCVHAPEIGEGRAVTGVW
jgi:serine/threonine protein kinase